MPRIGIGARAEAQLVGVRGQPDIDRQHPQLLQHFQNSRLGRNRQGEQHEVDAGAPRKFHDVVHLAALGAAGAGVQRAAVIAVVEHAENIEIGILLDIEKLNQLFSALVGADDDGAPVQPALACPVPDQRAQRQPLDDQRRQSDEEKCRKPDSRHRVAELDEE